MDNLQILAWRVLTKFLFWNQLSSSHVQEVYPSTLLDESSIEFEFETDRSIYVDMRDITFKSKLGYKREYCLMTMKKDEHGKADMGRTFMDDGLHYLSHVNKILQSLFSNCEVYLSKTTSIKLE